MIMTVVLVSMLGGCDPLLPNAHKAASTQTDARPFQVNRLDSQAPALPKESRRRMWNRFRRFAEREEKAFGVLFAIVGTAAGIALGVMSVLVSVQANRITKAQTSLMQHQNALAESQLRPLFRFIPKFATDLSGERFEVVEIYNDGGSIQILESWNTDVLEVVRRGEGEPELPTLKHIVGHYFGVPRFTGESKDSFAHSKPSLRFTRWWGNASSSIIARRALPAFGMNFESLVDLMSLGCAAS